MARNESEQIYKGLLDTLVLNVLLVAPNYGFGIKESLREQLGDDAEVVKEATLYPLLHRLERKELVLSYRQPGDRGTPRKYYNITRSGHLYLKQQIEAWRQVSALLDRTIFKKD
ncbi:MAG: helix-turn-helix transcriptional regulator [Aliidiomarina sp.]|uniref:PadR family transcriptional regulator n=1 Tax=Aliidiomarina sp. TaxID=1872439 RepID=UPI0025BCD296|nr:helix-turn-helix transcriptional regulator [Aliidiomarina sp.]MCH8500736.1 helix-turn-helix transcriptional regulator [Aliidiomarina sp.]